MTTNPDTTNWVARAAKALIGRPDTPGSTPDTEHSDVQALNAATHDALARIVAVTDESITAIREALVTEPAWVPRVESIAEQIDTISDQAETRTRGLIDQVETRLVSTETTTRDLATKLDAIHDATTLNTGAVTDLIRSFADESLIQTEVLRADITAEVSDSSATLDRTVAKITSITREALDAVRETIETAPDRTAELADSVAAATAVLEARIEGIEHRTPGWASALERSMTKISAQVATLADTDTPEWVTDLSDKVDSGVARTAEMAQAALDSVKSTVESVVADMSDQRPPWVEDLQATAIATLEAMNVAARKAEDNRLLLVKEPAWVDLLRDDIQTAATGLAQFLPKLDTIIAGQDLTGLPDQIRDRLTPTIENHVPEWVAVFGETLVRLETALTSEPDWLDKIGPGDEQPGWVNQIHDDISKMSTWLGQQASASSDQVIATLNEFSRQMQPIVHVADDIKSLKATGDTQTAATNELVSGHAATVAAVTGLADKVQSLTGGDPATLARLDQISDQIEALTAAVNKTSSSSFAAAVEERLGPRFETMTAGLAVLGDRLNGQDTQLETLVATLTSAAAQLDTAVTAQSTRHESIIGELAVVKQATTGAADVMDKVNDTIETLGTDWHTVSSAVKGIDAKVDQSNDQISDLVAFTQTTLEGLLTVLEHNDTNIASLVDAMVGPDEIRTQLAEVRAGLGGVSRDLMILDATVKQGGSVAEITSQVDTVVGVVASAREDLHALRAELTGNTGTVDEINAALTGVTNVRAVLESVDARVAELVSMGQRDAEVLSGETGGLIARVNEAAKAITEMRLIAAGQAEDAEAVRAALDEVQATVETLHNEIAPKISVIAGKAATTAKRATKSTKKPPARKAAPRQRAS